jgi:hypothetical protein
LRYGDTSHGWLGGGLLLAYNNRSRICFSRYAM